MNASSDYDYILAQFEHAYNLLNYNGDSKVLKRLDYITRLQGNIELNINGKHPSKIVEWCETLLPLVKKVGIYSKIYENSLTLYRKALVLDGQLHFQGGGGERPGGDEAGGNQPRFHRQPGD